MVWTKRYETASGRDNICRQHNNHHVDSSEISAYSSQIGKTINEDWIQVIMSRENYKKETNYNSIAQTNDHENLFVLQLYVM